MFWGREKELERLRKLLQKNSSSLVVCKGRRRIGKSTLIAKFAEEAERFIEFQGLPPREGQTDQQQRDAFSKQLSKQSSLPEMNLDNWSQAFSLLYNSIGDEKTVILFDEISWMAMKSKDFAGYLKIAWDTEFKRKPNVILVLCGSVSAWIENNIMKNTGFVGRVSLELQLTELSLQECNYFWDTRKERTSSREKLKLLSVTGGIPRYLEEIDYTVDADQNILDLCFQKEGLLFKEFRQIFDDIFSKETSIYKNIIRSLVEGDKTLSEVSEYVGQERGGRLGEHLENLIVSGFLMKYKVYKPNAKSANRSLLYRLKDNYLRFYFKYIENLSDNIENGLYEKSSLPEIIALDSIIGLQFETLVLNNLSQVCQVMKIPLASIISCAPFRQKKTKALPACQIDLLIQTKNSIYVCEIKFKKSIGIETIDEVKKKLELFAKIKNKSIRPMLIYEGELSKQVINEDFFDCCIDFGTLLK